MARILLLVPAALLAVGSLGCNSSSSTPTTATTTPPTATATPAATTAVKLTSVDVPKLPSAEARDRATKAAEKLKPALDNASDPKHAKTKQYVELSNSVAAKTEALEKKVTPLREALANANFKAAAKHATPGLLKDLETTKAEVGQLAILAPEVTTDDQGGKEEKSFWEKLLDILLIILRIVLFIISLLGSGTDGSGGADGGGTTTQPGTVMVSSGGGPLATDKPALVGEGGQDHIVKLDAPKGGPRALVVAVNKQPEKTVRLPLPDVVGEDVRVTKVRAGANGAFPLTIEIVTGGKTMDVQWDNETGKGVVRHGETK